MIARVVVDLKVKALDRLFDYFINPNDQKTIEKGMRVYVPFGEQKRLGYVIDIIEESEYATKEIIEVLDVIPSLSDETFEYINYLLNNNTGLLISAIERVIPSELFYDYKKKIVIHNNNNFSKALKELISNKKEIIITSNLKPFKNELKKLLKNKDISIINLNVQRTNEKIIKVLTYNKNHSYNKTNNYQTLINEVIANPHQTRANLTKKGFSLSSVNTLIKHHVFQLEDLVVDRDVHFIEQPTIKPHQLNKEQQIAYDKITNNLSTNKVFLLHGITGSGKTEVYMHVMQKVLNENKKILYLVPEITLIAPLMAQLNSRFNKTILHYNSNLSKGERFDSWRRINNNEADIIIGTRSAVFLPINELGLIVIDEEHDQSFNETIGMQYKTIDIAKIKANNAKIPIVLGSATPSVDTIYLAKNKKYELLTLTKRATKELLPKIHYVDMKEELKLGNTKVFSNILFEKIKDRLAKKEQIILLFNRKGYAPFTMCRNCGHIPKCPNCDVSLTYYQSSNELKCHHCGHYENNLETCPTCNTNKIKPIGMGTESIEWQVKKYFKDAKVIRMDQTTTTKKGSHEKIWNDFKNLEYDILIGTQMVSKGLDFPNVTLVGILMADLYLKIPSYYASEQTYSLLTQMSGRSGRKMFGEAVIQGYNLDHYAIKAVDKGYDYFYDQALHERKIANYTPFYEVSQILVTSQSYLKAYQIALMIKKALNNTNKQILGPAESVYRYLKGEYRFVITIKDKKINQKHIFETIEKTKTDDVKIYYFNIPEIM